MENQVDLTKLELNGNYNAFKNNRIYTGQFTISGTWVPGYQTFTYDVILDQAPDLVSSVFNGPTDTIFAGDPRPSAAWFKNGRIWVLGQNAGAGYTDYPIPYKTSCIITGAKTATITLSTVSEISPTLTLDSTVAYYRIIDYSVFGS